MLPLVRTPAGDASVEALIASLGDADEVLTRAGAVLFRGWDVAAAPAFERVARAIAPDLKNDYLGTSPRSGLTPYVFTASELPPHFPVPMHNEMSFVRSPPRRLFFTCLVPNRPPGGETPLVDMRAVWRDLDPDVRERFATRGVTYIRRYGPPGGGGWDPWKLKRWDEMFGTTDRDVVERRCAEEGFAPAWEPDGTLRLVHTRPAAKPHPRTGEPTWFNHSQVFHKDAAPAEYDRIASRLGAKWRAWGWLARALLATRRRHAMDCTYGDGSPIPAADMDAVRDAIWKNLVAFPWERGDVLAIDNDAVAHGRMPYRGERLVAVAWA
ncbi:MAG: TauD/TfdA family dioxygenase [Myxococcota bacterium]